MLIYYNIIIWNRRAHFSSPQIYIQCHGSWYICTKNHLVTLQLGWSWIAFDSIHCLKHGLVLALFTQNAVILGWIAFTHNVVYVHVVHVLASYSSFIVEGTFSSNTGKTVSRNIWHRRMLCCSRIWSSFEPSIGELLVWKSETWSQIDKMHGRLLE